MSYLGLDLGTTNVKAVVVDDGGAVAARGSAPVALIHVDGGGVEQDIDEIFAATVGALRAAGESADLSAVEAIGVSAQGGALQILDGHDRPVGRVISWLDPRGRAFDERITADIGSDELARRTGHPRGTMALGQLLRLRAESPELLAPPHRIGLVGDIIVSRLCGRRAHDATSLSCAVLFDPAGGTAETGLLERIGIDEDRLPVLLGPREAAGPLLPGIAERTGLRPGIAVGAAVHDQYACALGVGATSAGDVMFGAGTAWVLMAVSDRMMTSAGNNGFVCAHVVDGRFGQIMSMGNGGSAVTWALKLLGMEDAGGSRVDELLDSVPAGADGVRFWPFLAPTGGAGLGPGRSGRLAGLKLGHGPAHVLRAVVEGLCLELRRYLDLLTGSGVDVARLIMCG
ncbi:MAG: FGGY-family carbohydrate kinase, partial [Planctomycetota bacterium]